MKITVEPLLKNGVSISIDPPFSSFPEESAKHFAILKAILFYAFLERAAWIVTVEPQKWSLIRALSDKKDIINEKIDGEDYQLYYQEACSAEFLEEVAGEDEFFRALLWIVAVPEADKSSVYEIIRAMNESQRLKISTPAVESEWLFAGFDYAETVYWFNPPVQQSEILHKLHQIADSNNIEIDSSATAKF